MQDARHEALPRTHKKILVQVRHHFDLFIIA